MTDLLAMWTAHAARLLSVALRLTHGDTWDAEDLRSETFLRAARGQFRGESSAYTFLYAIMRNIFLDQRRRARRTVPLEAVLDVPAATLEPPVIVMTEEQAKRVRAAVARLPAKHQCAVAGHYFDGASYEEIGVGSRLRAWRGRMALRTALENVA